jgi:DNA-binding NarL/FixJ family response regulator
MNEFPAYTVFLGSDVTTFPDFLGSKDQGEGGLATTLIRILVVDDMEPFRRFIVSTLQARPELQVIAEASDGLDAVRKARELHPDLTLLDIGLPGLNGFEAARRIRRFSPQSKILFVSQEFSADVVQEAFRLGACGYVVKMDAAAELLAAVDAVLRGEQFAGGRFAGHDFTRASNTAALDEPAPESLRSKLFFAPHL